MDRLLHTAAIALVLASYLVTLISALPYNDEADSSIITHYDNNECRLCFLDPENEEVCDLCLASISDEDYGKRGAQLYHPLLRGGYQVYGKRSVPLYHPLFRGGYLGLEKRGTALFHPLFRGGYPKKNDYAATYNPILRGRYFKKAFVPKQPMYHPILRGGFGSYRVPRYNPTNEDI